MSPKLLLQFVVLRPIRRLSTMADEVSMGNMEASEYEPRGRDEIASLARSLQSDAPQRGECPVVLLERVSPAGDTDGPP